MKKIFLSILGVLIIFVGILGLLLPIVPGWVLIFAGLSMIAPQLAARWKRRLFGRFFRQNLVYLEEWRKTGAQAGFTTKRFPLFIQNSEELSDPAKQAKLLGLFSEDGVLKAHRAGPFRRFAVLNQVHGDKVAVLSSKDDGAKFQKEGFYALPGHDAVITDIAGLTLLAFSADCLTVFFTAGDWIGVAHAGWRGTQSRIVPKTLRLIAEKAGCRPRNVHVIFGPAIGPSHYEVGSEFKAYFRAGSFVEKNGKLFFNIAKENKLQLRETGLPERNISDHEICTVNENDNFHSFRKEKDKAGRTISFISKPV